jgi:hypothetical protein
MSGSGARRVSSGAPACRIDAAAKHFAVRPSRWRGNGQMPDFSEWVYVVKCGGLLKIEN